MLTKFKINKKNKINNKKTIQSTRATNKERLGLIQTSITLCKVTSNLPEDDDTEQIVIHNAAKLTECMSISLKTKKQRNWRIINRNEVMQILNGNRRNQRLTKHLKLLQVNKENCKSKTQQ